MIHHERNAKVELITCMALADSSQDNSVQPCTKSSQLTTFHQPQLTIAMEDEISKAEAEARLAQRREAMRLLKLDSRLSIPFGARLPIATSLSFVSGMALGITHGSQMAGLRFRAENAHRLPETTTGWYLYHKTKNYQMALGGVKEGMKMGAKLSFWVAGFFGIEEIFDQWRGTKDFVNTTIASLAVAGVFSLYSISPVYLPSSPNNC